MTDRTDFGKHYFRQMCTRPTTQVWYDRTIRWYAEAIRKLVIEGATTWDKLGFTDADVTTREQEGKRRVMS